MIVLGKGARIVLSYLLVNGPSIGNQINKQGMIKNSARAVTQLENLDMIKYRYTDEFSRPAKLLSLTLRGLINTLSDMTAWNLDITRIRTHWGYLLPHVFEKWNHFCEQKVEDHAKNRLITISMRMTEPIFFPKNWIDQDEEDDIKSDFLEMFALTNLEAFGLSGFEENESESYFTSMFYMSDIASLFDPEKLINLGSDNHTSFEWKSACIKDPELHTYFDKQLRSYIQEAKKRLESLQLELELIEENRGGFV